MNTGFFFALLVSFWSEKLLVPFNVTCAPPPCAYLIIMIQFMILLFQIFFSKSFSMLEWYVLLCFWCCPTNWWSAWHSSWQGVSCISRTVSNCSEDMFTVITHLWSLLHQTQFLQSLVELQNNWNILLFC